MADPPPSYRDRGQWASFGRMRRKPTGAVRKAWSVRARRPPNRENPVAREPHHAGPSAPAGRPDRPHPVPRPTGCRRGMYTRRRCLACFGDLLVHCRSDDVLTDHKSIAVAQSMRRLKAAFSTVHERAVGRDVVKPVAAVVPTYLAMLARDETAGIRQGPIEILIATDIEATFTLDRNAQWAAVGQGRQISIRRVRVIGSIYRIGRYFEA